MYQRKNEDQREERQVLFMRINGQVGKDNRQCQVVKLVFSIGILTVREVNNQVVQCCQEEDQCYTFHRPAAHQLGNIVKSKPGEACQQTDKSRKQKRPEKKIDDDRKHNRNQRLDSNIEQEKIYQGLLEDMHLEIANHTHHGPEFKAVFADINDLRNAFTVGCILISGEIVAIYGLGLAAVKIKIDPSEKNKKQNKPGYESRVPEEFHS